jgi:hypothetical protein
MDIPVEVPKVACFEARLGALLRFRNGVRIPLVKFKLLLLLYDTVKTFVLTIFLVVLAHIFKYL